jgi:transcriptional regulator with XRE-family HTH domain
MTEEQKQENRKRIGSMIAEARIKKGLNLTQLAEMTGLDRVNINKIELGKYNVSIDILNKICLALGCQISITEEVAE